MTDSLPVKRPLRVACHDFAGTEVDALRSLLRLLKDHLRQTWQVVEGVQADLVLVNLDQPRSPPPCGEVPCVGCALKPRLQPAGTIHRPLRAAEVLAVLTEAALQASRGDSGSHEAADDTVEWRYRLHHWPLEFSHWPPDAWRVLASITRRHCSLREIALRTRLPRQEIAGTLGLLKKMGVLDRLVERRSAPRIDENVAAGWRGLAARLGHLLRFAR